MEHIGRLPWFAPADLDPPARALYERITGGPRGQGPQAFPLTDAAGRLHGPFNALLVAPDLGTALQEVGSAIRYRSSFSGRAREIAILELSRQRRCDFEWYAHERIGRQTGLTEAELAAIFAGEPAPTLAPDESLVRELVATLVRERDLDDTAFAAATAALGAHGVMELIALVGYYDLLALSMKVWRTPLPAGADPVF